jgi:hypothetical protein
MSFPGSKVSMPQSHGMLENDVSNFNLTCPFCYRKIHKVRSQSDQSPYRGDYLFCSCGKVGVISDRKFNKWGWHVRRPTPKERMRIVTLSCNPTGGFNGRG